MDTRILALGDLAQVTKLHGPRLDHFVDALQRLEVPGDIVECGVWRGGAMMIARAIRPDRIVWLFDTFDGMTAPTEADGPKALARWNTKTTEGRKWVAASLDEVQTNFERAGLLDMDRLRFVVGPVEKTLVAGPLPDRIALLRLDTDWHASTLASLVYLYPRLVPGGVLIVDDFGHWEGARRAVLQYFDAETLGQLEMIDYTAVVLVKR